MDYTIFFRQLAAVVDLVSDSSDGEKWAPDRSPVTKDDAALVEPLRRSFFASPGGSAANSNNKVSDAQWANWLRKWLQALAVFQAEEMKGESNQSGVSAAARLRKANPKVYLHAYTQIYMYTWLETVRFRCAPCFAL